MNNRNLLLQLVISLLSAYFVITHFFSGETKFDELALGTETVTYLAVDSIGRPIHLQKTDDDEFNPFINAWKSRGAKSVVLFLGNSQTHSINQRKDGEVNYVEILHNAAKRDFDVLCISIPNAGLQEFYLIFEYWKRLLPIKTLSIPVFMDDMREDGIREYYFHKTIAENFQLNGTSALSTKLNKELQSYWQQEKKQPSVGTAQVESTLTLQDKTENYLNQKLDRFQVWSNRPNVRGEFFNWLYKLRNTVFGIKASTIRKMIPQRYNDNMEALSSIVKTAVANNTKVLLYIPPIRSDVKLPYDTLQYLNFKQETNALANSYKDEVLFKNFESIIPGNLWGYKVATSLNSDREIDYMHFQFKGHQILADSISHALTQLPIR